MATALNYALCQLYPVTTGGRSAYLPEHIHRRKSVNAVIGDYDGVELSGMTGKVFQILVGLLSWRKDAESAVITLRHSDLAKKLGVSTAEEAAAILADSLRGIKDSYLRLSTEDSDRFMRFPIVRDYNLGTGRDGDITEILVDKAFLRLAIKGLQGLEELRETMVQPRTRTIENRFVK